MSLNIYVQAHDKGIHLIEAFQLLFNKYWGVTQPVTILGYGKPDFKFAPNFSFVSLGEDAGPKIGADLIDFFSDVKDEHFVYTVYGQLIIRPVNLPLFESLAILIERSDRVGRIALTGDMETNQPYSFSLLSGNLVEHAQASSYRMSAVWSIWSKGYFLKYLEPDMDLWEWETDGSERAKGDGVQILSITGQYPITCCRIYKRGRQHADSFRSWDKHGAEMTEVDRAFVRSIMRGPTWRLAGESI